MSAMHQLGEAPRKYYFEHFEVDEATRTVRKHGLPVQVRGQSLDFLLALLKRPGQVVKREELKSMLWPRGTHVEFDTGLNSIVNRLRDALGDRAAKAKYIETMPRLGYRFAGRLRGAAGEAASGQALRLVVLPFANLSGDPDQEYLCDGLTEELIGQLATLGGGRLAVVARTSSMHYKGTRKGIAAIARELRADYVLEGSVRRSGVRVRVNAQFIEAAGQSHVWAKMYEGELGDLLHFQEQIGATVAGEICCATVPFSGAVIQQQAYDAYLRGRFQAARFSKSGLAAAVEYFEEAVSIEPNFAKAWAILAQVWADSGFWNHAPAAEAYPRAGYAAGKALMLDETLAEAHRALGTVHWFHHWDLDGAGGEFRRAVELKPGDAAAHLSYGAYLASMQPGSPRAAVESARARELDPLSALTWGHSAWVHLWSREYEQAIGICRRAIELDDEEPSAYYVLGLSLAGLHRWEESIRVFESAAQLQCGNMMLAYLAATCASAGQRARAVGLLAELERRSAAGLVLPTSLAFVHMGLGDYETAIDWLERALEERDPHVLWLRTSPRWDPVRGRSRFERLVQRLPSAVVTG